MKSACLILFLGLCFSAYSQQKNVCNGLKGKVQGLNVQTVTSKPGCSRNVKMNQKPVLVVDQKITPLAQLSALDPNDILSVSIIKGDKALLLYGPEAKDGVIIVTTKCKPQQIPAL